MSESKVPNPTYKSRRERYTAESRTSAWRRVPGRYKWLVLVSALAALTISFRSELKAFWRTLFPRSLILRVAGAGSETPQAARLQVLPIDRSIYLASPQPPITQLEFGPDGQLTIVEGQLPESFLALVEAEGYGRSIQSVSLDYSDEPQVMELTRPRPISGRVTDQFRRPVAAARVLALNDRRGALLDETRTDARGRYQLTRIAASEQAIHLRVLAPGFAMDEHEHWPAAAESEPASRTDFRLQPTAVLRGQVQLSEGLQADGLEISTYKFPGLRSRVGGDGGFEMASAPAGVSYQLLVQGIPAELTHPPVFAQAGDRDARILVQPSRNVHGRVLIERDGYRLQNAQVAHDWGPRGGEWVEVDQHGHFSLSRVTCGKALLRVTVFPQKGTPLQPLTQRFEVQPLSHPGMTPVVFRIR